ncbi:hypothetical protein D3C78_786430 [compost metagenome]
MDTVLILGGLLLILAGLLWLVARAFATSLLWGCASLLPPLPLLFIACRWQRARSAVVLMGMGCIPLVVGLTLLANHDPERLAAILNLRWLEPKAQLVAQDIQLHGELDGKPFVPVLGELIDGTLVLREGAPARRELRIRLPEQPQGRLLVNVLPDDRDNLPEIGLDGPPDSAARIVGGYTLHLDLEAVPPNLLRGDLHLVLPAAYRTVLNGKVELYTSHLRYREGRVDARHNSQETLEWVITDYLQRSAGSRDVELAPLAPLDLAAGRLNLDVQARVAGEARRLSLSLTRSEMQGWCVDGDQAPALPARDATAQPHGGRVAAAAAPTRELSRDRRMGFSLDRLLDSPVRYQGVLMQVLTERGGSAEGRFAGLNEDGRLIIRHSLGGQGEASFLLRPSEIAQIELLEP